jgi:hypothetical protein
MSLRSLRTAATAFSFLLLSATAGAQVACVDSWTAGMAPHGGPDGPADLVKTLDVGAGPELFVLGSALAHVGDLPVNLLSKWNGTSWSAIGSSSPTAPSLTEVLAMAAFNDGTGPALYVAGTFQLPGIVPVQNHVARWSGTTWTLCGGPFNAAPRALAVFNDGTGPKLVAGGAFSAIGAASANRVASWNGFTWTGLGGGTAYPVKVLEVFDPGSGQLLYAGGQSLNYTTAGDALQLWTGQNWSAAGPPGLQAVDKMVVHSEPGWPPALYLGGQFAATPSTSVAHLARLEAGTWTVLDQFISPGVTALASCDLGSGPRLYAGGIRSALWGQVVSPAWYLVCYVNHAITVVPGASQAAPHPPAIKTLAAFPQGGSTRLIAGGTWTSTAGIGGSNQWPDDSYPPYLAQWDGTNWGAVDSGSWYERRIESAVDFDDGSGRKLYVGGTFTTLGATPAPGLARWNGLGWEVFGAPLVTNVFVANVPIAIKALVAGDVGNGPALYIAGQRQGWDYLWRWDGSAFTSLAYPIFPPAALTSMVIWNDGTGPALWAGFDVGGQVGLRVFKNGLWQTLPDLGVTGPDGVITRLVAEPGGSLLICGTFTSIAGASVAKVARMWPGFAIDDLGADDPLTALPATPSVIDVTLYDSGNGPRIHALCLGQWGTATVATIRRFDGPGWTLVRSLPGVTAGMLRSVQHRGGQALWLGARVQNSNGSLSYMLERLDGGGWTPFVANGLPMCAHVYDDGNGGGTFIGGEIETVAGVRNGAIARLATNWPTILKPPPGYSVGLGQTISLSVSAMGAPPLAYQWFHAGAPIPGATSSSLSIPSAAFTNGGAYTVGVGNACGTVTSLAANVTVRGCDLTVGQPFGPGVLMIGHSGGPPSAHVFTAVSVLADNVTNPGEGNFFGLHIPIADAVSQFLLQTPPFVTTLSPSGSAFWAVGPLPPVAIGLNVFGVSVLYDPATLTVIGGASNLAHVMIH